jgi:hypothetical protein
VSDTFSTWVGSHNSLVCKVSCEYKLFVTWMLITGGSPVFV